MKPKVLFLLEHSIQEGINHGLERLHKSNRDYTQAELKQALFIELKHSFFKYFTLDEDEF